ncbi:MAG: hypothetical protein IT444_00920 [Phycisphaeraceae bacterium]|nr:hypothetical protein [Phycisphaeraceae bacterium]
MTNRNEKPIDAQLESLLDEVLAIETVDVPAGLADRICAATQSAVEARGRGVLARIGPSRLMAVAAIILLITGAALWLRLAPDNGKAASGDIEIARVKAALQDLTAYAGPSEPVDHELAELAIRVDHAHRSDADINDPFENLDEIATTSFSNPLF